MFLWLGGCQLAFPAAMATLSDFVSFAASNPGFIDDLSMCECPEKRDWLVRGFVSGGGDSAMAELALELRSSDIFTPPPPKQKGKRLRSGSHKLEIEAGSVYRVKVQEGARADKFVDGFAVVEGHREKEGVVDVLWLYSKKDILAGDYLTKEDTKRVRDEVKDDEYILTNHEDTVPVDLFARGVDITGEVWFGARHPSQNPTLLVAWECDFDDGTIRPYQAEGSLSRRAGDIVRQLLACGKDEDKTELVKLLPEMSLSPLIDVSTGTCGLCGYRRKLTFAAMRGEGICMRLGRNCTKRLEAAIDVDSVRDSDPETLQYAIDSAISLMAKES